MRHDFKIERHWPSKRSDDLPKVIQGNWNPGIFIQKTMVPFSPCDPGQIMMFIFHILYGGPHVLVTILEIHFTNRNLFNTHNRVLGRCY